MLFFSSKLFKPCPNSSGHFVWGFVLQDFCLLDKRTPMAIVTLTSASNASLSQTLSCDNNNNLRDASFSSYVNSAEQTFVRKLAESSGNLMPVWISEEQQTHVGRKKEDDEEIGVFGAEKYFKGTMDEDIPRTTSTSARKYQYKSERVDLDPSRFRIQPGTPSVKSESSSNSQSALLQSALRNRPRAHKNKVRGKSILAGLVCKCSCSDKDSVEIKEHGGEISFNNSCPSAVVQGKVSKVETAKTSLDLVDAVQVDKPRLNHRIKEEMHCQKLDQLEVGLNRESCFTFPTLDSGTANLPIKLQVKPEVEEKSRKSIEVFGSPIMEKRTKSLSIERRLTTVSWAATPRVEETESSAPMGGANDDTESDASSDLFEIESFTSKANPFLARQASDAMYGCVTPTTCYAPSEASIEWSVATASAADFSVMSDYEELRPTSIISPKKPASTCPNSRTKTDKEIQRRRSGVFLGCKSHKAVRVAGDSYRTNAQTNVYPPMRRMSDPFTPVTNFPAQTKPNVFNSGQGQVLATHSLPRSQSPLASHVLYL